MKKILSQGLIIIGSFFAVWFISSQIDWITLLKVEKVTSKTEEKLGKIFWDFFKNTNVIIDDQDVVQIIDTLVERICTPNDIDKGRIKVHILRNPDINAFALPDGHLVIYSELIKNTRNEAELCGILCHEIAHIDLNHVMKKLVKEIGLSVLGSIATGKAGSDITMEAARLLSSKAYDRSMEREADRKAIDYMVKAGIDPVPFADFFDRMADLEPDINKRLAWFSTHPETRERARQIIDYSREKKGIFEPVLEENSWERLQESLEGLKN